MTRLTLEEIKQSKNFYRDHFRRLVRVLLGSIFVILFLLMVLAYVVLNRSEPHYNATNSVGFIDRLTPLSQPNMSSQALLPPDPPSESAAMTKNMNFDTGQEEQVNPEQQNMYLQQ